jgi:hypothetical protein
MKVSIGSKIFEGPWGGGNLFVKNLANYLKLQNVKVIHDLYDKDIDVIILTDPRKSSYSATFSGEDIRKYLNYVNRETLVIHRFNECDERKNTQGVNKLMISANKYSDKNIFVSKWLQDLYEKQGLKQKSNQVIMTGADSNIFNNINAINWDSKSPLKIVTHHWGTNANKGFKDYKKLDAFIGEKNNSDLFEFTYIGNLPDGYKFNFSKHLKPLHGKELASELKKHHLYFTASKNEPSGNHHIEGAQCGLPILYLNSGGIPEFCHNFGLAYDEDNLIDQLFKIKDDYFIYKDKLVDYPYNSELMCEEYFKEIVNLIDNKSRILDKRNSQENFRSYSKYIFFTKYFLLKLVFRVRLLTSFYNYFLRGYLKIKSKIITSEKNN